MRTSEIAKRFLDYFEQHDHLVVPSASLISPNPTTLFTIAGMVPFIPYLMGEQTPPKHRMAAAVLLLGRRPISAGLSQLLWRAIKGNRFLIFFFESHFSESLRYHIGSQAYLILFRRW